MIVMYIDPGTGSMLFAILIGIIGSLMYLLKNWIVKLRFIITGGKKVETNADKLPFVIFSDDKRYWQVFEPVCREFDRHGVDVVYMTASPNDPVLDNPYEHIKGEFIGENNKAFAKMNFLKASIVLSTTPGLDVYQWKRSKDVQKYVHMLHMPNDVTTYRMFGLDYYDAVMVSGEYQAKDIRALEEQRGLPPKDLVTIGIPYLDDMKAKLTAMESGADDGKAAESKTNDTECTTVLLAPSWGQSGILYKYGSRIIDVLLKTGYHIIIRPHPQSFISEKELMDKLMEKYPDSEQLEWNRDNDNFDALRRSDIMISDFSGVVFDFSLVHDKPVIYADTEFDSSPYDAWWLDAPLWTFTTLPRIGQKLTEDNFDSLKEMIDGCLTDFRYANGRREARKETWEYEGQGARRAYEYLSNMYAELVAAEGGK